MTKKVRRKATALLCGAGMFLIGGTCVPENFWYKQWDATLTSVVSTAVGVYVLTPITEFVVNPTG